MAAPEKREEIGVGASYRVVLDPNHLDVVGVSGANEFVVRIGDVTLSVADFSLDDTGESLKCQLHSPEATGSELCKLETGFGLVKIRVESWAA